MLEQSQVDFYCHSNLNCERHIPAFPRLTVWNCVSLQEVANSRIKSTLCSFASIKTAQSAENENPEVGLI